MLVIDRVELDILDEPKEMGYLNAENAGWLQQRGQSGHEIVQVGNVGKHVVDDEQVGHRPTFSEVVARLMAEEHDLRGNPASDGYLGNVGGRLYTEDWD